MASSVLTAIKDATGRLTGFVNFTKDITEHLKAQEVARLREREAMQRQFVASTAATSLGTRVSRLGP